VTLPGAGVGEALRQYPAAMAMVLPKAGHTSKFYHIFRCINGKVLCEVNPFCIDPLKAKKNELPANGGKPPAQLVEDHLPDGMLNNVVQLEMHMQDKNLIAIASWDGRVGRVLIFNMMLEGEQVLIDDASKPPLIGFAHGDQTLLIFKDSSLVVYEIPDSATAPVAEKPDPNQFDQTTPENDKKYKEELNRLKAANKKDTSDWVADSNDHNRGCRLLQTVPTNTEAIEAALALGPPLRMIPVLQRKGGADKEAVLLLWSSKLQLWTVSPPELVRESCAFEGLCVAKHIKTPRAEGDTAPARDGGRWLVGTADEHVYLLTDQLQKTGWSRQLDVPPSVAEERAKVTSLSMEVPAAAAAESIGAPQSLAAGFSDGSARSYLLDETFELGIKHGAQ